MSKKRTKQYLMLLMVVGLVSIAAGGGGGTFASFNAQVTNAGNTFETGTLLLSNSVNGGAACNSDSNSGNTATCGAIINGTNLVTNHTENDAVTITNTGSLNSSNLLLWGSACSQSTTGTFPGGNLTHAADLCHKLQISIEQDGTSGDPNTATACLEGVETGGVGPDQHSCDPAQGTALDTWLTAHSGAGNAFTFGGDSLAPSDVRNYEVYLYLPNANNSYQGLQGQFNLTWHTDQ